MTLSGDSLYGRCIVFHNHTDKASSHSSCPDDPCDHLPDDPLCSTVPSFFFCQPAAGPKTTSLPYRCPVRSRRFPGVGSVFCSTALRMSVFRCESSTVRIPAVTPTPPIGFRFPRNLPTFQLPQDFRIVSPIIHFSFKKAVHDIMCIASRTACLRRFCIIFT